MQHRCMLSHVSHFLTADGAEQQKCSSYPRNPVNKTAALLSVSETFLNYLNSHLACFICLYSNFKKIYLDHSMPKILFESVLILYCSVQIYIRASLVNKLPIKNSSKLSLILGNSNI